MHDHKWNYAEIKSDMTCVAELWQLLDCETRYAKENSNDTYLSKNCYGLSFYWLYIKNEHYFSVGINFQIVYYSHMTKYMTQFFHKVQASTRYTKVHTE